MALRWPDRRVVEVLRAVSRNRCRRRVPWGWLAFDGKLSQNSARRQRMSAGPSRAKVWRRGVDSLCSGRSAKASRSRRSFCVLGDLRSSKDAQIHKLRNLRSYHPQSRSLRAPDDEAKPPSKSAEVGSQGFLRPWCRGSTKWLRRAPWRASLREFDGTAPSRLSLSSARVTSHNLWPRRHGCSP